MKSNRRWPFVMVAFMLLSACSSTPSQDGNSTVDTSYVSEPTTVSTAIDNSTSYSTSSKAENNTVNTSAVSDPTTVSASSVNSTNSAKTQTMPAYNGVTYSVVDEGAVPGAETDISCLINETIVKMKEGDTLLFPNGTYYLNSKIYLTGKNRIKIKGENATIIQAYDPYSGAGDSLLSLNSCDGITIEGLTFDYSKPISISGTVEETYPDDNYFIIRLFNEFSWVTGTECYESVYSHDPDGTPNGELAGTGLRVKKMDDGRLRVIYGTSSEIAKLEEGDGITLRLGGSTAAGFPVVSSTNILLKDITVRQTIGMVSYAIGRSGNITWKNVKVSPKEGSKQWMITFADNLWISEMTGSLTIEDCLFECLGDDALNVHHKALWVLAVNSNGTMQIAAKNSVGNGYSNVESNWALPGEEISLYDPNTFLEVARVRVASFDGSILSYELISGKPAEGCVADNLAFYPSVRVKNTTVTRTRARGFTIQSRDAVIENCSFNRIGLGGILVAPDIAHWNELGPSANVTIKNNTFDKCARAASYLNFASIMVKCSHDSQKFDYPNGVHKNITIENNVFDRSGGSAILVSSADGVVLKSNHIKQYDAFPTLEPESGSAIRLLHCTNVVQEGNKTDHGVLIYQE